MFSILYIRTASSQSSRDTSGLFGLLGICNDHKGVFSAVTGIYRIGKVAEVTLLNLKLDSDILCICEYSIGEDDHKIFKVSFLPVCISTRRRGGSGILFRFGLIRE